MTTDACPHCGIAVVPGYVRCPKCQTVLPRVRIRGNANNLGGTAVASRRFPIVAVAIPAVVVIGGIVAYLALRSGGKTAEQPVAPSAPAAANEEGGPEEGGAEPPRTFAPAPSAGAEDIAGELERALKRQRLWSTVEVGSRAVDVRSGSCADPGLRSLVDAAGPRFKAVGLTRLRCLEQSGAVVFSRDL